MSSPGPYSSRVDQRWCTGDWHEEVAIKQNTPPEYKPSSALNAKIEIALHKKQLFYYLNCFPKKILSDTFPIKTWPAAILDVFLNGACSMSCCLRYWILPLHFNDSFIYRCRGMNMANQQAKKQLEHWAMLYSASLGSSCNDLHFVI